MYYSVTFHFSGMLSHDPKLRCDLVDIYYTLYGSKTPLCLPIPELAMLTKPKKVAPPASPDHEVIIFYQCDRDLWFHIIKNLLLFSAASPSYVLY